MRSSSTLTRARRTSTARCRSLISWICSARSSAVNWTGYPPRRANGASIAITTAPCCASSCPRPAMPRAVPGMPCMSTMPGRRLERVTGSNNNPVTDPPSGTAEGDRADLDAVVRGFDRLFQVQGRIGVVGEQGAVCCIRHPSEIRPGGRTGFGGGGRPGHGGGGRLGRGAAGGNEQGHQCQGRFHDRINDCGRAPIRRRAAFSSPWLVDWMR